ncbi:MAG: pyridoxamine 5'-phosphate oxidase family protein [Actinomycetota bacterium]|nr:pyridoxamine 5'-phosphate oxidase family protein [Actinomycetota bacterium]
MSEDVPELDPHANPAGWPKQVVPMVAPAHTCHYASLTRDERPITWPVTPYINDDRRSVDVSTGLAYPAKAERARRNPNVGLLFHDAVGLTLQAPPTVLVLGKAAVRDSDLQANTDRYLERSSARFRPPSGRRRGSS